MSDGAKHRGAAEQEEIMKYICFGYYDEKKWETLPESKRRRSQKKIA